MIFLFRRPIMVMIHVSLVVLSNYLAFWLRFDGAIPRGDWDLFIHMLPWLLAVRGPTFIPFRLYEGLWRYTSIRDLRNIILGVGLSSMLFYALVHGLFGATVYPRSVFLIDSILLIFFLGGIRLTRRIYREAGRVDREKRILIYGAGDAGEMIARDMLNNPFYEYEPIGFVDDDPRKVGQRIHGLKVLGTKETLPAIIEAQKPDAFLVAIARIEPSSLRKLVNALERYQIPIKTIPNFRDLLNGTVTVSQVRNLRIEDLLERAPVGLNPEPVRALIEGQRLLVTGAGGSIGSELCRQILLCRPSALILLDRYENGLHEIACELEAKGPKIAVCPVIGDVTDRERIGVVMRDHRPALVFHAAAHKHVPLMELNPCEAVKNNIFGTQIVAECAAQAGVERFLLISTDKAVNPTSVMGATKRVAEMLIQSMNGSSRQSMNSSSLAWTFATVRFGNVLSSNGSAVPRFLQQIKAGGPVTVTDPEMRRFFMSIPEAVQLVLHAAAMTGGGEVYVLDMGEQIKVVEMVKHLIRLSGFIPEEEIPITYIGVRPGEKLYEELTASDEVAEPSGVAHVMRVRTLSRTDPEILRGQVAALGQLASQGDADGVITLLGKIVPTYQPFAGSARKAATAPESCPASG